MKCEICGSRQSEQKGGVYDDSKKNVMILVCPKCGRKCPDCGAIQKWEDVGERIKGQGSVNRGKSRLGLVLLRSPKRWKFCLRIRLKIC